MKGTRTEITAASVRNAIKGGAKTLTAILKAHGYSSVCSANTKKIRAALPEVSDILSGKVPLTVPKAKTVAKKTAKKTVAKKDKTVVKSRKKASTVQKPNILDLFRGPVTLTIARLGSDTKHPMTAKELDQTVADHLKEQGINKTVKQVSYTRSWMANKDHQSNRNRTQANAEFAKRGLLVLETV